MNISVLGTGTVGRVIAASLSNQGHQVFMGTRNVADSLTKTEVDNWGNPAIGSWIREHPTVELLPFNQAVERGNELIVFAIHGKAAFDCLDSVGESLFNGKVMIDISNPLDFGQGFPPLLFVSNTESLGEQIQGKFPELKVVKTLNTISHPVMVNPGLIEGDHTVFISGNDQEAKATATGILTGFGWKDKNIIDLGDITTARGTEMMLPLWVRLYGKLQTPYFNFHVNSAAK